ncbi:MAG: hypothetical protein Q9210_004005 [Variospora velana]
MGVNMNYSQQWTHRISPALLLLSLLSLAHIINGETTPSPTSLHRVPVSISPLENTHNQPSFPQGIPFRQRRSRRRRSIHPSSNAAEAETTPASSTAIILGDWHAIPHPSSHTVSTTLSIYTQFHRTLISNISTDIFTTQTNNNNNNNNTLTLTLGHLLLTITWNSPSDPLLTPRNPSVTPKPKEVLDQMMMDLHNHALRGFIGLGRVYVFVKDFLILTAAIAVLPRFAQPRPRGHTVWNIVN